MCRLCAEGSGQDADVADQWTIMQLQVSISAASNAMRQAQEWPRSKQVSNVNDQLLQCNWTEQLHETLSAQ